MGKKKPKSTEKAIRNLAPKGEVKGGDSKVMGQMLSNVQKTRAEISQTFARNSRA